MNSDKLKALCQAPWVSGSEVDSQGVVSALFGQLGQIHYTPLGSAVIQIVPPKENSVHLMLDAHLDQIGMIVTDIDQDGFVHVSPVGGLDKRLMPACRVRILGREQVLGVVSALAPHLSSIEGFEKLQDVDKLLIDTGFSRQHLQEKIALGDLVCFDSPFVSLQNDLVGGHSLDNRISVYALYLAAKQLKDDGFDKFGIDVVLSSREEIGGQGALTASNAGKYSHAVVVDVSFAMSHGCDERDCKTLAKGPMIGYSPILNRNMYQNLCAVAKEQDIPHQFEMMSGRTGTNADSVTISGQGVKCAMVSIPLRYMHSFTEVASLTDIENTAKLLTQYIKEGTL